MKKLILATFAVTCAINVLAQGTVILSNRSNGQITHIWGPGLPGCLALMGIGSNDSPSGTTPFGSASGMSLIGADGSGGRYGYATTFAQLIGANGANQPESALVPVGQTTTFRSGAALGNLASTTDTLTGNPGIPANSPAATFEIVAWDNSSGMYPTWTEARPAWQNGNVSAGHSAPFTVTNIGGVLNFPPFLNNNQPITSFNLLECIPDFTWFWLQPTNQTVGAGQGATFRTGAAGNPPFTYQWRINGAAIVGATISAYTMTNAQLGNIGNYSVVVADYYHLGPTTSSNAFLNISNCAPVISSQPQSQAAVVGANSVFSVTAAGTAPLSYQWQWNGTNINAATTSTLTLTNVQVAGAGSYVVVITNVVGSVTSSVASLAVLPTGAIVSVGLSAGTGVSITCFSQAGSNYVLEYKNALDGLAWTPLLPAVTATGGVLVMRDTNAPVASRYYRVHRE